ncbi:MAG: hypothetical protein Q9195_005473 [Heterodermia aff. obscurata]
MIYEYLRSVQPPTARVGIACVYCDSQQRLAQTAINLLACLWSSFQPTDVSEPPPYIANLYRHHKAGRTRPDLDQVLHVIQSTIDQTETAYVLIDGLDECSESTRVETMNCMRKLLMGSNAEFPKLRVLVTSRLEQPLLDGLSVKIQATPEEVGAMVKKRMKMPSTLRKSLKASVAASPDLQREILDKIVTKANGMFLIADLQLKSLATMVNIRALREKLDRLPETLDQYYDDAWVRMTSQEQHLKEIAHHTISWLYGSRRQLMVDELRHALSLQPGDETFCAEGLTAIEYILDACQGLVVVEGNEKVVRLMHSTVRDYFQNRYNQLLGYTAVYLTETCLTYLCLDVFEGKLAYYTSLAMVDMAANPGEEISSNRILSCRLSKYPFLDYAAKNWGFHACDVPDDSCLQQIMAFLKLGRPLENAHLVHPQVFHRSSRRHIHNDRIFADLHPIRVAISFGLERLACHLIKPSIQALSAATGKAKSVLGDHMLKALLEAMENGRLAVTKALLDAGVQLPHHLDPSMTYLDHTFLYKSERPETPLDKSVFYRQNAIADLLVEKGVGGMITETTMNYAVLAENRNLLNSYLSKHQTGLIYCVANGILHFASIKGKLSMVQYSLENGALIESRDHVDDLTALGLAAAHGRSSVVDHLLRAGADVSAIAYDITEDLDSEPQERSILEVATTSQQIFKNRLRLANDHNPMYSFNRMLDSDTEQFQQVLNHWFAREMQPLALANNKEFLAALREDSEHGRTITTLLNYGADASERGKNGESFLHLSVISATRLNVFIQYLQDQTDTHLAIDIRDHESRTPLHWAAAMCNHESMEMLLRAGADISAKDCSGATVLHYSLDSSACVKVALAHGCRADIGADELGTPLQLAQAFDEAEKDVIQTLESALKKLSESGTLLLEQDMVTRRPQTVASKAFESWLISKANQNYLLSEYYIEMCLRGSEQQEFVESFAAWNAHVKRQERTWTLVDDL